MEGETNDKRTGLNDGRKLHRGGYAKIDRLLHKYEAAKLENPYMSMDEIVRMLGVDYDCENHRRAERVQVASRVLAAIVGKAFMPKDAHDANTAVMPACEDVARFAIDYADALLARIDETEPKDVL